MKFKGTYIVASVFLVFFAYVYFYEILGEPGRRQREIDEARIHLFNIEEINRITISRPDVTTVITKRGEDWVIEEPVEYAGDFQNIELLLYYFSNANNEGLVSENKENPDTYGLNPDAPNLTVIDRSGAEFSIVVGNENPTKQLAYVMIPENPRIYLTASVLRSIVLEPLITFRDKTTVDFEVDDLKKVIFNKKDVQYIIEKDGNDNWQITQPVKLKGDNTRIFSILSRIQTQKIVKFNDATPGEYKNYGLDEGSESIEFFDEGADVNTRLIFGNRIQGNNYVHNEAKNTVFEIDTMTVSWLTTTLFDLRSKEVVIYEIDDIDQIEITYGDESFEFQKDSETNAWFITSSKNVLANSPKIRDIVKDIYWTRAEIFIDEKNPNMTQYGLKTPVAEFRMSSNGVERAHVQLGKLDNKDNKQYFFNKTMNQIFKVRSGLQDAIVISGDDLLQKVKL